MQLPDAINVILIHLLRYLLHCPTKVVRWFKKIIHLDAWINEGKTIHTVKLSQLHFRARPYTSSSPGSRVKSRGRGTGQFTRGGGRDLAARFVELKLISDSGLVEEPVAGRSWCSTLRGQILSASPSMLTVRTPCTRGLARTSAHIWICLFSRLNRSKQDMITKLKKNPKHE